MRLRLVLHNSTDHSCLSLSLFLFFSLSFNASQANGITEIAAQPMVHKSLEPPPDPSAYELVGREEVELMDRTARWVAKLSSDSNTRPSGDLVARFHSQLLSGAGTRSRFAFVAEDAISLQSQYHLEHLPQLCI